jgi:hypothetical protein
MPYWLETDAFHELPVWEVLAAGNADRMDQLQAAYVRLKSLASHLQKDGYLTADGALRQCRGRRQVLEKMCTPVLDEKPLVHRPGDECPCLGELPWVQGFAYRIHAARAIAARSCSSTTSTPTSPRALTRPTWSPPAPGATSTRASAPPTRPI